MKRSELIQIIREEIKAISKPKKINEGFFDNIIDSIFGDIKKTQEKQAYAAMEKDPEFQKAKKKVEDAVDDAKDFLKKLKDKYDK